MVFSSFLDGDHETGNTSTDPERASPNGLLAHGLPLQAFKSHPLRDTLYIPIAFIEMGGRGMFGNLGLEPHFTFNSSRVITGSTPCTLWIFLLSSG
jgi:hypothetical protein